MAPIFQGGILTFHTALTVGCQCVKVSNWHLVSDCLIHRKLKKLRKLNQNLDFDMSFDSSRNQRRECRLGFNFNALKTQCLIY
jgi:hypothetical protein